MEIINNNLRLKTITYKDKDILYNWYNDGSIMRHAYFKNGLNIDYNYIDNLIKLTRKGIKVRLLMYINNEPIGDVSYKLITDNNYKIGINIYFTKYQNKGYGTNFLRMLINYLFKEKQAKNIYLDVRKINQRAIHVYEKIGFKKENEFIRNRIHFISYKLIKDDFYVLNKYKYLLFDIDDTLLSFYKAERKALSLALNKYNIKANDKILNHYHKVNIKYWEMVERNIITRNECLIKRFEEFLPLYNIKESPSRFEDVYRYYLNKQHYVIKDARKVLDILSKKYEIYSITNGVYKTQVQRIHKVGFDKYFIKSFISEKIGFNKPNINYMNHIINSIVNFDIKKALIIGDSLTSDIKLGINSNIETCHFNIFRKDNKSNIKATFTINYLNELLYLDN